MSLLRFVLVFALAGSGCAGTLRADGRWTELRGDHVRLLTDVDPAAAAREVPRVETVLAGIAARVRPDRPLPPRLDVLWLRGHDALGALGMGNARGYYLPHQADEPSTPPLVVVAGAPGRELERVLVHELAHVIFVDAAPAAPAWLAEGMAAWWDTLDVDRRTIGIDDDQQDVVVMHTFNTQYGLQRFAVQRLLRAGYAAFHELPMDVWFYGNARAFVAMLEADAELAPRLDHFIARLRDAGSERAWAESFAAVGVYELEARYERFFATRPVPLPLSPWLGEVRSRVESPAAVERWLARARPWDSPRALAEAGRALARAAGDDSAERHYWSGVYAAALGRWDDALAELRAALAREPGMAAASSARARVEARLRLLHASASARDRDYGVAR